jgi:hypothetical protein
MEKRCQKCKIVKSGNEFHNNKSSPDGKNGRCKECRKLVTPEERERDNKRRRETMKGQKFVLKKLFNMTMDDYNFLLENQKGCCAICDRHYTKFNKRMPLDHDHKTNKPRGILCDSCNIGLGIFNDDPIYLNKLVQYLNKYKDD